MSRNPAQTFNAPAGLDLTSDPVAMPENRAQALINFSTKWGGKLQAQGDTTDQLPMHPTTPIDGIAWYYNATIVNTSVAPFPSDVLLYVSNGLAYFSLPNESAIPPFGVPTVITPHWQSLPAQFVVGKRVRSAALGSELILVQEGGVQPQRIYSDSTGLHQYQSGMFPSIFPPTAVAANDVNGIPEGTYDYYFTFVDNYGRESSPSAFTALVVPAANVKHVTLTITFSADPTRRPPDPQTVAVNVYRTINGGDVFYRIATVPAGVTLGTFYSYTLIQADFTYQGTGAGNFDITPDAVLQTYPLGPNFGENDVPNPASIIVSHKNRIVMNDVLNTEQIQISNTLSPTQYTSIPLVPPIATDGETMNVGTDQGDTVQALYSLGSFLLIFKRRSVWYMAGFDSTDFTILPAQVRGCISPDSAVRCDNSILYLSDDGVYAMDGNLNVQKISKEVEKGLLSTSRPQLENSFGWFANNVYSLCTGSDIWNFNFDSQSWSLQILGYGEITIGKVTYEIPPPAIGTSYAPPVVIPPSSPVLASASNLPKTADEVPGTPPVPVFLTINIPIPSGVYTQGMWYFEGLTTLFGSGTADLAVWIFTGTSAPEGVEFPASPYSIPHPLLITGGVNAIPVQITDINAAAGSTLQVAVTVQNASFSPTAILNVTVLTISLQ